MKTFVVVFVFTVAAAQAQNLGVSTACGTASGTRFNLEPRTSPLPQDQTAVDVIPGAAAGDLVVGVADDMRALTAGSGSPPDFRGIFGITSQTGFYVHRNGSDSNPCAPDLEGGLGPLVNPADGQTLVGVGFAAVAADATNQTFFVADTRVGNGEGSDSAIAVFRTTVANLNNPSVCPDGTLTESQSTQCWPTAVLINSATIFTASNSSPHLAVDERPAGSAAGAADVYIAATQFVSGNSIVVVTACKNNLSACSAPVKVSAADAAPDLPHVAIRPDGRVTLTYVVQSGGAIGIPERADIKFVLCTPAGAPQPLSCSAPVLVASEMQAIPFNPFNPETGLGAAQFVMHTYPKHTNRQDANGIETYIVWDRCKVSTAVTYPGLTFVNICPDADLLMAATADDGKTWQFSVVDTGDQDQFQPWITTDPANQTVTIAYYSSGADAFQHRPQVLLRQILPGSATPDPVGDPTVITTMPMEPSGDAVLQGIFIGDYLGVAARGGHAYIHHTHTAVPGLYGGMPSPEQNNHLSRFDY